jgi:glutathione synthase/RimK-type ligase-like ATP-grasp enzyme
MQLALVTESRYLSDQMAADDWYRANVQLEDRLLSDALRRYGIATQRVDWRDQAVAWRQFDAVLVRTTWDYFDHIDGFVQWIDDRAGDSNLINPPALLRWNLHKRYLHDLQAAGASIVPSRFLDRGSNPPLDELLACIGSDQGVLKPCISGGARNTYRLSVDDRDSWGRLLRERLAVEDMIVQPFLPSILSDGEVTLVLFAGEVTHAIRKRGKAGDFRVQDDHGGTVHPHDAMADEVAVAKQAFAACPSLPVYGRVDLVRDALGQPRVMELEIIEPELWLRFHPPSAASFAAAIADHLKTSSQASANCDDS